MKQKRDIAYSKYIDTTTATNELRSRGIKITRMTLTNWLRRYDLGFMIGGRWYVHRDKFMKFIEIPKEVENEED